MNCIDLHTDDPYFNLAAEEYLMKQSDQAFFVIYVNRPCVVVGKHQNACAEVNQPFADRNGIAIARRISGGGTVYHDPGNLNFSFITNEAEGDFINFKKYTAPVVGALSELGLKARLGKRNEILLKDLKITGTASHVFKRRVLHHGTLLFDARREWLSGALAVHEERYAGKAVKSVRSEITNINDHLEQPLTMAQFSAHVFESVMKHYRGSSRYDYTEPDLEAIRQLAAEKYATAEWIFGYSPSYRFHHVMDTPAGVLEVDLEISKGIISGASVSVDGSDDSSLSRSLIGKLHAYSVLMEWSREHGFGDAAAEMF